MRQDKRPSPVWAARDEAAAAYAEARRLVFDLFTPDTPDWPLTNEQRRALRRLVIAEARLRQLRFQRTVDWHRPGPRPAR